MFTKISVVFEFGLWSGAKACVSHVAIYFPRRVSSPGCYFEGVAFRGFPYRIPKVRRNFNLLDLSISPPSKGAFSFSCFSILFGFSEIAQESETFSLPCNSPRHPTSSCEAASLPSVSPITQPPPRRGASSRLSPHRALASPVDSASVSRNSLGTRIAGSPAKTHSPLPISALTPPLTARSASSQRNTARSVSSQRSLKPASRSKSRSRPKTRIKATGRR